MSTETTTDVEKLVREFDKHFGFVEGFSQHAAPETAFMSAETIAKFYKNESLAGEIEAWLVENHIALPE